MPELTDAQIDKLVDEALAKVVYAEEDGEILATVPDLPGAWGSGKDEDAATDDLRASLPGYFALN